MKENSINKLNNAPQYDLTSVSSINKLDSAPHYDLISVPFGFHLNIDSLGTITIRVCGEYITIDERKLLEFIKTLGVEGKNE